MARLTFSLKIGSTALTFAAAMAATSLALAQAPLPLPTDRVSQVTVTPAVADVGVLREIKVSGVWPGCVPVGATTPGGVRLSTLVVKLVLPATLVACPAAFLQYSVTAAYTPIARGINKLLVLNADGEFLGEALIDTRAADDHRSAFNMTGMWYDPKSNGSGLTFVHSHATDNIVFGTWYVYDEAGKTRWYTIQNTEWKAQGRVLEGLLYQTSGMASCPAPFTACPARMGSLTIVGRARITVTGGDAVRVEALKDDGSVIFVSSVIRVEI